MTPDMKRNIITTYGIHESTDLLNKYYYKSFGYTSKDIKRYFHKYNLDNKKIQLILQKSIGLDVYY